MADTNSINIPGRLIWTLVPITGGRISPSSACYYAKFLSGELPDNNIFGYRLMSSQLLDFNLTGTEQLYVKSETPFRLTYTEGEFDQIGGGEVAPAEWPYNDWFGLMTQGKKAVVFQNYTEANVKNGLQFYMQHDWAAVAVGTTVYISFVTGSKPVIIKSRDISFNGSSKVSYLAYEGASFTGGTLFDVKNENRISPVATTVSLRHSITVGSLPAPYRVKTVFGSGATTGGGSRIGTDVLGRETILKPNTTYIIGIINLAGSAADIQLELSWYEGTPDLPA